MKKNNIGLIFFQSHPIQYISPLLKVLAKAINLDVFYFSDPAKNNEIDKGFGKKIIWDRPLLDGYQYKFLKNRVKPKPINNKLFDVFNPGVIKVLWQNKSKIIIVNGWTYSSNWLIFLTAWMFSKKIWLRGENPLNQELQKSVFVLSIKKLLLQFFLFKFFIDKFLYIGSQNKAFYKYYGVTDEDKFIYTPYSVDNIFFNQYYYEYKDKKDELRVELNLPLEKRIILFSGKYINKKRPLDLLNAFSQLPKNKYALVMVGEGELRTEMEKFISENNLEYVYLTGFINQSQIPKYYAVADVFVMCSGIGETWGLSVNEAMNFALPVVVSDTCGCACDLVMQNKNGYIYKTGNVYALKNCLLKFIEKESLKSEAGGYSKEIIQKHSIDVIVENIKNNLN